MTQRELVPEEIAAMWIWSEEYAKGGLGAIEFYARLSDYRKGNVADFLRSIRSAEVATSKGGRLHGVRAGVANV